MKSKIQSQVNWCKRFASATAILFTRETFYDSEMIGAIYLSGMSKVGSLESTNGHQLRAYWVSISGSIVENSSLKVRNLRVDSKQIKIPISLGSGKHKYYPRLNVRKYLSPKTVCITICYTFAVFRHVGPKNQLCIKGFASGITTVNIVLTW